MVMDLQVLYNQVFLDRLDEYQRLIEEPVLWDLLYFIRISV
jgi:hypothetical protein